MKLKIISDIHGEYEALAGELERDDVAVLLGDYLNLIDFRTLGGILSEVYTPEEIIRALSALAAGRKELARRSIQEIAGANPDKYRRVVELMRDGYQRFFESLPCRSLLLYGNTDNPSLMRELATGDIEIIESGVVQLEGVRLGFVSGSPEGPWTVGLPGEVEPGRYREMIESLGPVDVLLTHYPPAVPDLTWDTLANRDEAGSVALLEYIDKYNPSYHYFGHVHNPRESRAFRGSTELVNAGFFRELRRAIVHGRS